MLSQYNKKLNILPFTFVKKTISYTYTHLGFGKIVLLFLTGCFMHLSINNKSFLTAQYSVHLFAQIKTIILYKGGSLCQEVQENYPIRKSTTW